MQIIPAIDIFEGNCVRLMQGEFAKRTVYSTDPSAIAKRFLDAGATRLHVVDLEGSKEGRVVNTKAIGQILSIHGLEVQVGGGIRSAADIASLLDAGAVRVVVGSEAVRSPQKVIDWAHQFGPERFCVALDLKNGFVAYNGWQSVDTQQLSTVVLPMLECGITYFLSTDIARDGMLTGPNVELYSGLVRTYPGAKWIASGGVGSLADVRALEQTGVEGVIIGKALYEGTIRLEELLKTPC